MRKVVIFIILIFIVFLSVNRIFIKAGEKSRMYSSGINLQADQLGDGFYKGHFGYFFNLLGSDVKFEVKNGKIVNIDFDRLSGTPFYGASEIVIKKIKNSGNLNFDAVTGATITSNMAKAAINIAIENKSQKK